MKKLAKKTKEIGRQEVNQYKIYIKFDCILVDPIVPPPKPKAPRLLLHLNLQPRIEPVCPSQERDEQTKGVRRDLPDIILKK